MIKRTLLSIFVLLLFFVAILPNILSQSWLLHRLVESINQEIPGNISIQSLRLSWFGKQQLYGLELRDPAGQTVVLVDEAQLHTPLLGMFQEKMNLGILELQRPFIKLYMMEDGSSSLQKALILPVKQASLGGQQSSSPSSILQFSGKVLINNGQIHIQSPSKSFYDINGINLALSFLKNNLITFSLTAATASNEDNDIAIKGTLDLNSPTMKTEASVHIQDVAILSLIEALNLQKEKKEQAQALIGEKVSIDATCTFENLEQGSVHISYQGTNSTFALEGSIENATLYLDKPATLFVTVNPNLSRLILGKINPLLISTVSSDRKLSLQINPEGFAVPLFPFSLETIQIPNAAIVIGVVSVSDQGLLSSIFNQLQPKEQSKHLSIWFTPQYFSVMNGFIQIMRTDFLIANTFPLAFWGSIDMMNQTIDSEIGISRFALQHSLQIPSGNPQDLVTLALYGNLNDPEIDTTTFGTKIAALLAEKNTGDIGTVIGALLQQSTAAPFSKKAPPPTTNPLPWQEIFNKEEQSPSPAEPKKKKGIEKAIKNLLKKL